MPNCTFHIVDAFTAVPFTGNPYAVVILNSPTTMTRYSDFVAANDWIVSNAKALRKIQQQASL